MECSNKTKEKSKKFAKKFLQKKKFPYTCLAAEESRLFRFEVPGKSHFLHTFLKGFPILLILKNKKNSYKTADIRHTRNLLT